MLPLDKWYLLITIKKISMKKIFLSFYLLCFLNSIAQVVPNKDLVVQVLNNSGLEATGVASAIDRVSGAIYTCGFVNTSSSGRDLALVKMDTNLVQQFIVTYDFNNLDDRATALYVDPSAGDIYVTGFSTASSGNTDIITIKYNSSGVQQWAMRYNGTNSTNDAGASIALDGSGNVWVAGYSTTTSKGKDFQVLKYSNGGTLLAAPKRNGTANADEEATKLCIDGGNVYITGNINNNTTNKDILTICINASAVTLTWSMTVNGSANGDDIGTDIKTDNGEVFICGKVNNTTTNDDYYFARLNQTNGNVKYSNSYDGGANGADQASELVGDGNGFYAVTGIVTNGSVNEYHTRMYDTSSVIWSHIQPINGAYTAVLPSIACDTIAYHFYVAGTYSNSTLDGFLYQLDPTGVKRWSQFHNGTNSAKDAFVDVVLDGFARIFVVSPNESTTSNIYDYMLIRYSQTPLYWPPDLNNDSSSLGYQYIPNVGQLVNYSATPVPNIKFYTPSNNPKVYIHPTKNYFVYAKGDTLESTNDSIERIQMDFLNANIWSEIVAQQETPGYMNFFLSHLDSGKTGIKGYKRLFVPNIWQGVDLHYYSTIDGVKYYLVLKQGIANLETCQFRFDGQINDTIINHEILIDNVIENLTFNRPKVFQVDTSLSVITSGTGNWRLITGSDYGIDSLTNVIPFWPIIIQLETNRQPAPSYVSTTGLDWSTFVHDGTVEEVRASNLTGRQYLVGWTSDINFPTSSNGLITSYNTAKFSDAFIIQFKPNNQIHWATYYGSAGTGSNQFRNNDYAMSVDYDSLGYVYVGGYTYSDSIPTWASATSGSYFQSKMKYPASGNNNNLPDAFILKLDSTGRSSTASWHPEWCTFLGGKYYETINDIRYHGGYIYCVGDGGERDYSTPAYSTPYQYKAGAFNQDSAMGFFSIYKFNKNLIYDWGTPFHNNPSQIIASSYMTLTACDVYDNSIANKFSNIATSNTGLAITGVTDKSGLLPRTTAGANLPGGGAGNDDAFISIFDSNDSLIYSTYVGSSGVDRAYDIACKGYNAYIVGWTSSPNSPVSFPTKWKVGSYCDSVKNGSDGFISQFDCSTGQLIWSSLYGGTLSEQINGVCIDTKDNVFVHGTTNSNPIDIPSFPSSLYSQTAKNTDETFVGAFNDNDTLRWMTYFGGNGITDNGKTISVYKDQEVFVAGGGSFSAGSFPTTPLTSGYYTSTGNMYISKLDIYALNIGIKELSSAKLTNDIHVFPNPATNQITLKVKDLEKNSKLDIYNAIGQNVFSIVISSNSTVINIEQFTQGIYFIRMNLNEKTYSGKFIKQ